MKTQFKFRQITILLAGLCLLFFTACGKKDKTDPDNNDNNTGGKDMVATIAFESGDIIDFGYTFPDINLIKPTISHEKESDGSDGYLLTVSGIMGGSTISIIGVINNKEGSYSYTEDFDEDEDETGVNIWLHTIDGDDIESFLPFRISDETMGSANITITSLTKNHIKATFSATLYSQKTGKKVTIKGGKIDSKLYRREVE